MQTKLLIGLAATGIAAACGTAFTGSPGPSGGSGGATASGTTVTVSSGGGMPSSSGSGGMATSGTGGGPCFIAPDGGWNGPVIIGLQGQNNAAPQCSGDWQQSVKLANASLYKHITPCACQCQGPIGGSCGSAIFNYGLDNTCSSNTEVILQPGECVAIDAPGAAADYEEVSTPPLTAPQCAPTYVKPGPSLYWAATVCEASCPIPAPQGFSKPCVYQKLTDGPMPKVPVDFPNCMDVYTDLTDSRTCGNPMNCSCDLEKASCSATVKMYFGQCSDNNSKGQLSDSNGCQKPSIIFDHAKLIATLDKGTCTSSGDAGPVSSPDPQYDARFMVCCQ